MTKGKVRENLTIPNFLSVLRIVIIIPMVKSMLRENYAGAGILLTVSAASDMFDGIIARKFNQITQLGKILDPIADKLTLIAIVICVNILYPYILLFVSVLFAKEVLMLLGGGILLKKGIKPPPAQWYGKAATAIFYISVIIIVSLRAIWGVMIPFLTTLLFTVTTAVMFFALLNYAQLFFNLINESKNKEKEN